MWLPMLYDIFDKSFLLQCLYFASIGPFALGALAMGLAAAALLAGGFMQFFLLRRVKWACLLPIMCGAAEAVFEVLYQMTVHGRSKIMGYDAFWEFILWGVLLLYVLLGTFLGWGVRQMLMRRGSQ